MAMRKITHTACLKEPVERHTEEHEEDEEEVKYRQT